MCNRQAVIDKVKETFDLAEEIFSRSLRRPARIRFDKKGTSGGQAHYSNWELNFNEVLLNENFEDFLEQTVVHECAHLINYQLYESKEPITYGRQKRRSPHGRTWKNIMVRLGADPLRCHDYDTSNVARRRKTVKHVYHCTGCNKDLPMGTIRHNKIKSGERTYFHCQNYALIDMNRTT